MHQHEADERYAEHDRQRVDDALDDVDEHALIGQPTENRREVLEPVLRLHEALHLRPHRARVDVVRDEQEQRVVDELLVRLLHRLPAAPRIERRASPCRASLSISGSE